MFARWQSMPQPVTSSPGRLAARFDRRTMETLGFPSTMAWNFHLSFRWPSIPAATFLLALLKAAAFTALLITAGKRRQRRKGFMNNNYYHSGVDLRTRLFAPCPDGGS